MMATKFRAVYSVRLDVTFVGHTSPQYIPGEKHVLPLRDTYEDAERDIDAVSAPIFSYTIQRVDFDNTDSVLLRT